MNRRLQYQEDNRKNQTRCNDQIRVREVLLVENGQRVGIVPTYEAIRRAQDVGLDLVEVAPNAKPPVCSIMDYGKYQYEKQKKEKSQPHSHKEKEIDFRYVIDIHDLETKANNAKRFLEKGHRVKLIVKFKAREKAHKDQGFEAMKKMLELLKGHGELERPPVLEGNQISARVEPLKSTKESKETA